MLSPALEDLCKQGKLPEVRNYFKLKEASRHNYSVGHPHEGFWVSYLVLENAVELYFPFKAPVIYKLPDSWQNKALVLFAACWNKSSVILEQVTSNFNLEKDLISSEINFANFNTENVGKRFIDL